MRISGKTIIVTGAASGIGRALCIALARRGASLALVDADTERAAKSLSMVEAAATNAEAKYTLHQLDVSQGEHWQNFKQALFSQHDHVDGIINNAGITRSSSVDDMPYEQLEQVMNVNFMGVVYGSKEMLTHLRERPEAFIANVSSVLGFYPLKNQAAYCSSKYAVRGFTGVLAQELKSSSIHVACIHPGHIGTNILESARRDGGIIDKQHSEQEQLFIAQAFKATGLSADDAAERIIKDLEKRKTKIVIGKDAVRSEKLSRFFPKLYINAQNNKAL